MIGGPRINFHGMSPEDSQEALDNAFAYMHYKKAPLVELLDRLVDLFLRLIEIEPTAAERIETALKQRRMSDKLSDIE